MIELNIVVIHPSKKNEKIYVQIFSYSIFHNDEREILCLK